MTDCAEPDWVTVYRSRRAAACHERALVLLAMGIAHRIDDGSFGQLRLSVAPEDAAAAMEQLRLYERENPPRPTLVEAWRLRGTGIPGIIGYALVLLLVFVFEQRMSFGVDWRVAGMVDGQAVRDGEWWRLATALTLHADPGHLAGNLVLGAIIGLFVGQVLGSGLGWCAILLAAIVGNALNVAVQAETHRSLGASTAVFAALGLFSAWVWVIQVHSGSWARRWAPVVAGAVLLAWFGTGDERTDIVAHLTGFIAGFAAGVLIGRRDAHLQISPDQQRLLGILALLAVAACWWLATIPWRRGFPAV
ncbi:MAG: rhomboid family intramembrane serine protease [Chromatiales bacterium]|nr:rhomboid family intramembrane serine protease [Chromatiales bacterium]